MLRGYGDGVRVLVELSQDVDVAGWPGRHAAGLAADRTPYGLHHLEEFGHIVRFAESAASPRVRRVGGIVSARAWGAQPVHTALAAATRVGRGADVVLCTDERTGIPAALLTRRTPVVSGIAWLEDPDEFDDAYVRVARRALQRMAGVFVECSAMLEPLAGSFGVARDRLHFVHFGIDEQHFSPSVEPPIEGRVFSVGDDRMRDHETLAAALHRVHAAHPQMTAELATTLPVELPSSWAQIHRRRMDAAVRECYARASIVAVALKPTRQGSGLTVILEAMASGRPVVVTDNPGLSDYVEHGVTGLLVPPGSPEAMANAINTLLADPDRARQMGEAGRRRVETSFTTRHMAADIDRILHGVDSTR